MRAWLFGILIFMTFGSASAVSAEPLEDAQSVIERQIGAFLADDADTAYSFASPGVQQKFPNRDIFFDMVKRSYAPVYHPGNYAFGRNKIVQDGAFVVQEVLITGKDGKDWSAFYQLSRQADGSYRIDGVQMMPNTTSSGI